MSYLLKLVTIVFFLFTLACSNNKPKEKTIPPPQVQEIPTGNMFNGKTLEGWEITSFGTEGPVYVSGGNLVLNYGDGCTGVTWTKEFPKVNYEVTLKAMKTSGNDFFCGMTFPVNNDYCSFIVGGWGGPVVGLSCIDGKDASDNNTKILKRFEKDIWYKIRLQVNEQKIIGWIDEEKLVDFEYLNHELYIRPEVELSKPFGICTWITTAKLRNINLTEL